ncbi:ATP-binding protein [Pacificibacter sp.]|uniref:ATP-binding protein n=1 Tax=Pacificibacter sp. TaxID=1917866 RepID=UPI003219AD61
MHHEKFPKIPKPATDKEEAALRLVIPANEEAVREGLSTIKSGLSDLEFSQDEWSTLELVVAEVLNNIVVHAYQERNDGMIETHMDHSNGSLLCKIIDTGNPMPGGELPNKPQSDLTCATEDLPEGGFGWFLIRQLTKDLNYGRMEDQNVLTFRLKFGEAS